MNASSNAAPLFVVQEGIVEEMRTEKGILSRFPTKWVTMLQVRCKGPKKVFGDTSVIPTRVTWMVVGGLVKDVKKEVRPGQSILLFGYPQAIQGGIGNALIVTRWYLMAAPPASDAKGQRRRLVAGSLYPISWGPLATLSPEPINVG